MNENNPNQQPHSNQNQGHTVIDEFSYSINSMAGRVKKTTFIQNALSPRNSSKTKMYLLFLIGSGALVLISYLVVKDINFYGLNTYLDSAKKYWSQNTDGASATLIVMVFVNLFWILINIIIEFLAITQEWIPKKTLPKLPLSESLGVASSKTLNKKKHLNKFDEVLFITNLRSKYEDETKEDEKEYLSILHSPILSPLAFLWIGVKRIYRFFSHFGSWSVLFYHRFLFFLKNLFGAVLEFIANCFELFIYFLNPFNIIEEIIDILITLLVRVFYPAILTPIIFFLPIKEKFYFTEIYQVIFYILLIGGLRVGVEFFSIYIRFLRNTRVK